MLRAPIYKYFRKRPGLKLKLPPRVLLKNVQLAAFPGSSHREHIFVVGPPRNGTTLIQKIIANHPLVSGPDTETFFFLKRRLDTVQIPEISSSRTRHHFERSRTTAQFFDLLADEFTTESQKFVEKSPEHALVMKRIFKMFPKSTIIFVYRDGRDAYVSSLRHPGVRSKIGKHYPRLWRDCMAALTTAQDLPNVIPLKYEDLCTDPAKVLKPALEQCGLSFSPELIAPESYSKTQYSQKNEHKRLAEKISAKTVGIHRLKENAEDRRYFESIAEDMLVQFGYSVG